MVEGKTREETIRLTAEALGISVEKAAFIIAQEYGEIDGDVITVDDAGNEVREPDGPERIEGPTPNGGAYALAYRHDDGSVEIVECDADGGQILRTYLYSSRPR